MSLLHLIYVLCALVLAIALTAIVLEIVFVFCERSETWLRHWRRRKEDRP